MKVLLGTQNKDKFKIVKHLLLTLEETIEVYSLLDISDEIIDKPEEGDIVNRASEKAISVKSQLTQNKFDYIVGLDDGIMMKERLIPNVKEYIQKIVYDEYLQEGELVSMIRAYSFLGKDDVQHNFTITIPYQYKKTNDPEKALRYDYPLSYVLTPIDGEIVVGEMSEEESGAYFYRYTGQILKEKWLEKIKKGV